MTKPRLIQTFLPDGTFEGIRIIELSESQIKAFVIPRIKLRDARARQELKQPALYLLINSAENQLYIGESENFFDRLKNHDQTKSFWDVAVAIVSNTNTLEKSDIKYLESLAVEQAKLTAAMEVMNRTIPARNNVHEFKLHSLQNILDDISLIAETLGYSVLASTSNKKEDIWYCKSKKTVAEGIFRGDKFVVLAGSTIDTSFAPSWEKDWPHAQVERQELFKKYGKQVEDTVVLTENIPFKSPNHAGGFVTGRSVNAWTTWKNKDGKTMDEVIRQ